MTYFYSYYFSILYCWFTTISNFCYYFSIKICAIITTFDKQSCSKKCVTSVYSFVYSASSDIRYKPLHIFGKSIFWYFNKFHNGHIAQQEGVSVVNGLYFVGLPWQTSRGSALLGWVKYDAKRIVDHLVNQP